MSWPLIHTLFDHYHHVYLSGRILSYDETSASAPLYYRTILYTCIVPSPTYPNDRPHYSTILYMIKKARRKESRKIIRKGRKEGRKGRKEERKEGRKDFLLLVLLFGFTRSF